MTSILYGDSKKILFGRISSCRLCGIVVDQHYFKNLFNRKNQELFELMHQILRSVLQRDSALPKLVCCSCERKVRKLEF